jgi:hypothetical protein
MAKPSPNTPPEASTSSRGKKSWSINIGAVLWGFVLLLTGTLFLLDNLNIATIDTSDLWRLWPIFIIIAGASLIRVHGWLSAALAATIITLIVGTVGAVTIGGIEPDTPTTTRVVEVSKLRDDVERANITLGGGAGSIDIRSSESVEILRARLESNFTHITQRSSVSNDVQNVELSLNAGNHWWRGNYTNDLAVTLSESLPLSLNIDAGASRIRGDLSDVELRRLDIDSGASNLELRLGSRQEITDVAIDIGVSSCELLLPKDAGISVRIDSGLSNINFAGLREVSNGYYESDNYDNADKKIHIRGSIGMAKLTLKYY